MIILLVGKSRTPKTQRGHIRHWGARCATVPPSSASRAVCLACPNSTSAIGTGRRRCPVAWSGRAAMTGSLPMDKDVVGNVDGAPREGDATVQHQVQKHFDHLLLGKADVQCPADMTAQG